MSLDNLKPIALAIAELDADIKQLTKKKKELEEDLRPSIVDKGDIVFGDYQFSCVTSPGRKTLDKKMLEESGVNLEPFMKVGKPFTTLKIKKVNVVWVNRYLNG